jgi:hypothetical protein
MRARTKLRDALPLLTAALHNLRECAREHLAFVIIEDDVTGRFVQFSGSNCDPLWFDAPQLGVINSGPKFDRPEDAAEYALRRMRLNHRLPESAELHITFESTRKNQPS